MKSNNPFKHLIQQPLYRVQYIESGEYIWHYSGEGGSIENLNTKDWNKARAMDAQGARHYAFCLRGYVRVIRIKD